MSGIKNTAQVETYNDPAKPSIKVHSHWMDKEMVLIQIGDEKFVVSGIEMKRAIDNCMNV